MRVLELYLGFFFKVNNKLSSMIHGIRIYIFFKLATKPNTITSNRYLLPHIHFEAPQNCFSQKFYLALNIRFTIDIIQTPSMNTDSSKSPHFEKSKTQVSVLYFKKSLMKYHNTWIPIRYISVNW